MDGLKSWKTLFFLMDDLGGKPTIFGNTLVSFVKLLVFGCCKFQTSISVDACKYSMLAVRCVFFRGCTWKMGLGLVNENEW